MLEDRSLWERWISGPGGSCVNLSVTILAWYDLQAMGFSDPNSGKFKAVTVRDGKEEVFCTDDEGTFIRYNIEQLTLDYKVAATVKVEPLGDRWFRVEITFTSGDQEAVSDICDDLHIAFWGKGWYEYKEEGQNDDCTTVWYVVRHNQSCPMI